MAKNKRTKKDKIRSYLEQGHSLTQRDAIKFFNSYRLSAVVWDLINIENMNIKNIRKSGHAEYKLIPDGELAL